MLGRGGMRIAETLSTAAVSSRRDSARGVAIKQQLNLIQFSQF